MSDVFNLNRFGKYLAFDLKSQWKENAIYLVTPLIWPVAFYIIFLFFSGLSQNGISALFTGTPLARPQITPRSIVFAIMTVGFLISFPAKSYGFVTEKAKGSEWLELPASRLEKFLSMMLISLVVIPAVFFCGYLLSDALVCLADNRCGDSIIKKWSELDTESFVRFNAKGAWLFVSATLQAVSVFLLGALIFKKGKVAKTIIVLFVLAFVMFAVISTIISSVDFGAFGDRMETWLNNHADNIDFWINFWANVELILVVCGLGLWSWFRVKKLQH
ncbi:MAG: hypothetical protein IJK05_09660 [Bacteroidales bacterium]|nr:hypothetical protein [Bacteroidales bacterium]